jgi:hypothetical protein
MTAPEIIPQANVTPVPFLGEGRLPNYNAGSIALEGIQRGLGQAGVAGTQISNRDRQRLYYAQHHQQVLDEKALAASQSEWITRFKIDTAKQINEAATQAISGDPSTAVSTFDEKLNGIGDRLDEIDDGPHRATAELHLTESLIHARNHVSDVAARGIGDKSRATVFEYQSMLMSSVASGTIAPDMASRLMDDAVDPLIGTGFDADQAAKFKISARSQFESQYADVLLQHAATSPQAGEQLKAFINSPLSEHLSPDGKRMMLGALAKQEEGARRFQAKGTLEQAKRQVAQTMPNLLSPSAHWAVSGNSPNATIAVLDDMVHQLVGVPGMTDEGTFQEHESWDEANIRKALFTDALQTSAVAGDPIGVEVYTKLIVGPANQKGDAMNALPATMEIVQRAHDTLETSTRQQSIIKQSASDLAAHYAAGEYAVDDPAWRSDKGVDKFVETELATNPLSNPAQLARYAVVATGSVPGVIQDRVKMGLTKGSNPTDFQQSLDVIRAVGTMNPLAADRLTDLGDQGYAARVLLNLPYGMVTDEAGAQVLLSREGRAGYAVSEAALAGKMDTDTTNDVNATSGKAQITREALDISKFFEGEVPGLSTATSFLPADARRQFEAAFQYRMAAMASADSGALDKDAVALVQQVAADAARDVAATHAIVHIPLFNIGWLNNYDANVMVNARMFGLTPGVDAAGTRNKSFSNFMLKAASPFEGIDWTLAQYAIASPRPDLAIIQDEGMLRTIAVPIIDKHSTEPLAFAVWNPNTGEAASDKNITPTSDPKQFQTMLKRFRESTDQIDRDPDYGFRRKTGTQERFMEDSAGVAERFRALATGEYSQLEDPDFPIDAYLNNRALELGWDGFTRPVKPKP